MNGERFLVAADEKTGGLVITDPALEAHRVRIDPVGGDVVRAGMDEDLASVEGRLVIRRHISHLQ